MTETLTKEKIEQLAPDQASLGAALKLMKPASWPMLSRATQGEHCAPDVRRGRCSHTKARRIDVRGAARGCRDQARGS